MSGPDFDKNPLIQALDAKRKAAEAAEAAIPRVVGIKTGKAYEPPPPIPVDKPKRARKPKVDKASVEQLESLLARAKAGELHGLLAIMTDQSDGLFLLSFTPPPGEKVEIAALRYLGGMVLMKDDLANIADYGLEPDAGEVVMLFEGDNQ